MRCHCLLQYTHMHTHAHTHISKSFPGGSDSKESTCNSGDLGFIPALRRSPGGEHGNPLQYSCLENPHEQKSLADYSLWHCKELDMTEWLSTIIHTSELTLLPCWIILGDRKVSLDFDHISATFSLILRLLKIYASQLPPLWNQIIIGPLKDFCEGELRHYVIWLVQSICSIYSNCCYSHHHHRHQILSQLLFPTKLLTDACMYVDTYI